MSTLKVITIQQYCRQKEARRDPNCDIDRNRGSLFRKGTRVRIPVECPSEDVIDTIPAVITSIHNSTYTVKVDMHQFSHEALGDLAWNFKICRPPQTLTVKIDNIF